MHLYVCISAGQEIITQVPAPGVLIISTLTRFLILIKIIHERKPAFMTKRDPLVQRGNVEMLNMNVP